MSSELGYCRKAVAELFCAKNTKAGKDIVMSNSKTKTLFQYVFPAILTNACIFLFTIIDGIFVGNGVDTNALGAVNIAMPFVMIATALNMLTSIGGVTVCAIRLGREDKEGANNVFLHSLTLNFSVAVIFTLVGMLLTEPLCKMLGADAFYLPMVKEYVFWWSLFAIPSALSVNFQCFCRNDGSPMLVAAATVVSTVLNIFLDWLFIFPFKMGIMGAAVATGISQTISWLIVLLHFIKRKGDLRVKKYKPEGSLYRKVVFRGLPEMIAQFATPVTTICLNHVIIQNYGELGVNSFAIISYVASFAMSILFGASEGLQPLFGQCYGAKEEKDLKFYFRSGLIISAVGSTICVLLSAVFAKPISTLFGGIGEVLEFTVKYMPQYAWAFIIAGFNTLISAYLYSTKRSVYAIILNVMRSFVINTLIIVGLSAIMGNSIVWFTFGISEIIVLVVAIFLKQHSERNGIEFV